MSYSEDKMINKENELTNLSIELGRKDEKIKQLKVLLAYYRFKDALQESDDKENAEELINYTDDQWENEQDE